MGAITLIINWRFFYYAFSFVANPITRTRIIHPQEGHSLHFHRLMQHTTSFIMPSSLYPDPLGEWHTCYGTDVMQFAPFVNAWQNGRPPSILMH